MSDGDPTADEGTATTPTAPINRLSIAHLLLWTTMTSVALVCELRESQTSPFYDQAATDPVFAELRAKWKRSRAISLVMTPASGAALAGAAVGAWRAVRRRSGFPTQPGHWLLIVVAAQHINNLLGWNEIDVTTGISLKLFAACAILFVPATAALVAAIYCTQRRWKISFALLATGYAGAAVSIVIVFLASATSRGVAFMFIIPSLLIFAAYGSCLISSIWDGRSDERRDLLHWAGCFVLFANIAATIAVWCIWQIG